MNVAWMGERVAEVDLGRVLENLVRKRDDVSWGPNATFKFPLRGGTGAIWSSLHRQLPQRRCVLSDGVAAIDADRRELTLASGRRISYERLISTMPRDELLARLHGAPELQTHADRYVWSASHIVGVGIEGRPPEDLRTKCWIYFPEASTPFYRVTVFSNYSPHNVPEPGRQWSLMAEISESPRKPVDHARVVEDTVEGLRRCGFLRERGAVLSTWHRFLPKGYPTPWCERDAVVDSVEAPLQALGIWSRGRFGLWKYEVSNQDHSSMQGVWAAEAALCAERTPGEPFVP
jgi:protoporphyrinogen oxidase